MMEIILEKAGYSTLLAENGVEALGVLDSNHVDFIVLDIMMPEMDGYMFAEELRSAGCLIPIMMVTSKQLPADKRKGFLAGTDDYMTKPVDTEEMLLRIKALLRRSQIIHERKVCIGEVVLDYDALTVFRDGKKQTLPPKEFYLLYKLLSFPGKIFTRLQLMDEIWGMETGSADMTINVHINRLRRRFKGYPEFDIVSVRGLGYKAEANL
jgi:DNA-binding response OmpR family regulator